MRTLRFIDLFAGLGGTRIGLQNAADDLGIQTECVYTSDKKKSAARVYASNFSVKVSQVLSDITKIKPSDINGFDMLLGGFPCQPFSRAGVHRGFEDTRGTLFFNIAAILSYHRPEFFILENVDSITRHDNGKTIETIRRVLKDLGYNIDIRVFNAAEHGVPQRRSRTFIVGSIHSTPDLRSIAKSPEVLFKDIREKGKPIVDDDFTRRLLKYKKPEELQGAILLDKRNGRNTIHSWDFGMRGDLTQSEKDICNWLLDNHRKRKYADEIGVQWRDGMPLNIHQISNGMGKDIEELMPDIEKLLDSKYIVARYPYKDGSLETRSDLEIGYRIDTSRLNFEFNRILDDNSTTHTLTATDADRCGVVEENGIRRLTRRECLRLFGFPEWYSIEKKDANDKELYDLIGNSICVPVVEKIAKHLLAHWN